MGPRNTDMPPDLAQRFLQVLDGVSQRRLSSRLYKNRTDLCPNAMALSRWRRRNPLPSQDVAEKVIRWAANQIFKGKGSAIERIRAGFVESYRTGESWVAVSQILAVPNELKALRGNLTQAEAGKLCGVSRQMYNYWEGGDCTPRQLERARRALSQKS